MRNNKVFLSQISKYAADGRFEGIFSVHRKPANFSHPAHSIIYDLDIHNDAAAPKNSM